MVAERQDRYPRGTYKLQIIPGPDKAAAYRLTNLVTRRCYCCCSLYRLLNTLDRDLTDNRYPQRSVEYRTWEVKKHMKDFDPEETSAEPATVSPTFVIRVLFRQNATWQGSIQWLEGKQTRQFRSEYEMLKLMDEAVRLTAADDGESATGWLT